MKIGFDAKRLFLNYTGLGNYSRTVVRDLQKYFPEHEYHLYTTKALRNTDTEHFFDKSKFTIHENHSFFNSFWRSVSIVKDLERDNIEIYHGLSAELPLGIKKSKVKSVVTIHDLIFKHFKSDYKLIDRTIYDFKSKYACEAADKIISISDFTKKDISKSYKINEEKISVVYLQINDRFLTKYGQEQLLEVKNKFDLSERFFLYVGSVIGRKNLKLVIKAMAKIESNTRMPLVVVGSGKKYLEEVKKMIADYGLDRDVFFLKNVSNDDLPKIYQLSHFFVFPSLYEGFGLPVLEAIQSKKQVIVAEDTSLVEVVGNCGVILPQNDVSRLSDAIVEKSKQPAAKPMDCQEHLKQFDDKTLSYKIMDIYKNLKSS